MCVHDRIHVKRENGRDYFRCRLCGEVKDYQASWDMPDWQNPTVWRDDDITARAVAIAGKPDWGTALYGLMV